jgi:hypothetical protein
VGVKTLSGDVTMKYEYEIIMDYGHMLIEEAHDLPTFCYKSQMCRRWEIHRLKKSVEEIRKEIPYGSKKEPISSFKRTRDWVLQTHPELLL